REHFGDRARKSFGLVPIDACAYRHDHMQALSTGGLEETGEAEIGEEGSQQSDAVDDLRPQDTFTRIEIEDQAIGPLELRQARSPRMQLDQPPLQQNHQ